MKIVGIIAEFNPFHNGHRRIFEKARESGADHIVVVMSGDYVQRGLPAITDKFTRCAYALDQGADLVLELPIYYSLGSAEFFASGAISVLNHLGCVDTLLFGSEYEDISTTMEVAKILLEEPVEYTSLLKKASKEGLSYPAARQKALTSVLPSLSDKSDLIVSPNNILGIEYTKALLRSGSTIKPMTISRSDNGYSSTALPSEGSFASATSIREILFQKNSAESKEILAPFLPESVLENLLNYNEITGYSYGSSNAFSDLLKYKLMLEKYEGYGQYWDLNEDLSAKIANHLNDYTGFEEFALSLKSKDITYTRLCRCLMHILFNMTDDKVASYQQDNYTTYLRVLGLKRASSGLLKNINSNSDKPLIQNLRKAGLSLTDIEKQLLNETVAASSIYDFCHCKNAKNEYSKEIVLR
ncbi:MAG: nucleotidyltransferase family protein [Butyrivibrio sp.]|nr:nucleotidyltransferase family protein [Butyrivibrio sp.]